MRNSNYLRQSKRRHHKSIINTSLVFISNDQIIGKETLASMMDVTITSVERWIRAGMPVEQRGNHVTDWIFNLNQVMHWKAEH